MGQPKTSSTTAIDTTITTTTTTSINTSFNTTQDARIQPNGNKGIRLVFLILSIVAGVSTYFYMDLTWDLIYKNELIFKFYIALAALVSGSLTLTFNKKFFLAVAIALLTASATLNKELFIQSNDGQQNFLLLATFFTEFLIATLLCIYIPHIKDLLIKK